MTLCSLFSGTLLNPKQRDARLTKLISTVETLLDQNPLNKKVIYDTIRYIDQLWFRGQLLPLVNNKYGPIRVTLRVPLNIQNYSPQAVAGAVFIKKGGIYFMLNRQLFDTLFLPENKPQELKENGYHVGGVVRTTRAECVAHVICHEVVHLLMMVCDKDEIEDQHNLFFKNISFACFGHTTEKHGLVQGLLHTMSLQELKLHISAGQDVLRFLNGRWVLVKVTKKGGSHTTVEDQEGNVHRVHIGFLKPIGPRAIKNQGDFACDA